MLKQNPVFFKRLFEKFALLFIFLIPFISIAQGDQEEETQMRLFIDCNCDRNYVRQEIPFVDHVRDQSLANVQLFIYDVANGSGGRTYLLDFKGAQAYTEIQGELSYETTPNMTSDEVRKGLVAKIKLGLLKYILESNLAYKITYSVNSEGNSTIEQMSVEDPWNNWIFEIYGEAELSKESSRNEFEYEVGFESDRVTEKWRIRADLELNQATSRFQQNNETFTSERLRYSADASIVRSLTDHWSTGIFVGARHNTFTNQNFSTYVRPAIEYNIFPYREVLQRELVLAYRIGYFFNDYIDTTIFEKDSEGIFNHSLDVQLRYRQPWGNIYSRLRGSTFLEDFNKNRVQLFSRLSVRIFKGLGVTFSGNFEVIRDQINLPAGDASIEDVLLQQKQIATDFELGFRVGLSYTFGSAFNNIINNRL
ncbi:hypothetical protein PP182_15215 [Maribacter sp. PR1]|uniref:DUF481 domain-containing protein n=1 Tax=Maribacter cobaltidurans TaxID=1178778 RepID=A0ABU7IWR6_9FLAO|nr:MULTISPECIES: hypothetical protein [Maribacter]MDC6390045.1 hypothetical protein [Maribacter sp. PR1]MEE1977435.1 hypothetical protein [Maribacter cobaltidurans]